MIRKVLQSWALVGLAMACSLSGLRADDPGKVSSRRTRHWTTPAERTSAGQATRSRAGGLSDRMKAIRNGAPPAVAAPPATASGAGLHSVLQRPAAATHMPAEPRSLRAGSTASSQPIRLGRRTEPGASVATRAGKVQAASQLPAIRVEMTAPHEVVLGRPASWQIKVRNDGERASPPVRVLAGLPANATVASTQATHGQVGQQATTQRVLEWRVDGLAAHTEATLAVSLVARTAQPMQLQLQWQVETESLSASIEVREPKLEVAITGPSEMKHGSTAEFTVTLYNPGSGPAEDVTIEVASGDSRTQPQRIGTLPAGGQRTIPVDLTADQAGDLEVVVSATASGGLKADSRHQVRVRRPRLEIAVNGPTLQYAGVPVTYSVDVANRGDTESEETLLQVDLPSGAKVTAASAGAREVDGQVVWDLGELAQGTRRVFQFKLVLAQAGTNRIRAAVRANGGESATAQVETKVELVADLKLTVHDPAGPQPVGEEIEYRIVIENRGSKTARSVQVVAHFSEGIEPEAASGKEYRKLPGQVMFSPIEAIAPGQKVELVVTAIAQSAGSHRFRAEVECKDIETRLAAEETTKCFQ